MGFQRRGDEDFRPYETFLESGIFPALQKGPEIARQAVFMAGRA